MKLAAALGPLALDAKQALRLRRFGLAAFNYVIATSLAATAWAFDELPASAVLVAAAAFVAVNLGVYAAILSGFNLRFKDLAIGVAKRTSHPFALLFRDLDRFKPVNDALGHTAGDELLIAVAARIRMQVRESDTVARVGGDEFTVILPDIERRAGAEVVAAKIIAAPIAPFALGDRLDSVEIGTSIGIAMYPDDALEADELVSLRGLGRR